MDFPHSPTFPNVGSWFSQISVELRVSSTNIIVWWTGAGGGSDGRGRGKV